jgi:hypothetical protein
MLEYEKEEKLMEKSNPYEVYQKAKKIFGDDVKLKLSPRKNKKYMLYNPDKNDWIHFGDIRYEDFTKHQDKKRRYNFLKRNQKWAFYDRYTSGFLSYYLLW